jgi:RNA-directed DNA polymerase
MCDGGVLQAGVGPALMGLGAAPLRGYPGDASYWDVTAREWPHASRGVNSRRTRRVGAPRRVQFFKIRHLADLIAERFTASDWTEPRIVESVVQLLGKRYRWIRPLVGRILKRFGADRRPRTRAVAQAILDDPGFDRAFDRYRETIRPRFEPAPPPVMRPAIGFPTNFQVPAIVVPSELADRLGLTENELDWFADLRTSTSLSSQSKIHHYRYRWMSKRFDSARLIEAPKYRLKRIQRFILEEILNRVHPHDAAHAYRSGRSIRTFAEPHVGAEALLKMDLRNFFPSIRFAAIFAIFSSIGYPERIARSLAGLCSNVVPKDVWNDPSNPMRHSSLGESAFRIYTQSHLPQGAPTSPALANLRAYRLDLRLSALAKTAGVQYTRYADDLAFSGNGSFGRSARGFSAHVAAIAIEEGFSVNHHKTRLMLKSERIRIAGVVVNEKLNVPRDDFDRLKATLNNCVRRGPEAERRGFAGDFRASLQGRIAHVASIHPERGEKLKSVFDQILW